MPASSANNRNHKRPELIIGLVGPIGCDIESVETAVTAALKQVDYRVEHISLSKGIAELLEQTEGTRPNLTTLKKKIDAGNKIRKLKASNGILAAYAMSSIHDLRSRLSEQDDRELPEDTQHGEVPLDSVAFLVRQFKRPEEIQLMRKVYGNAFILISVTQSRQDLLANLKYLVGNEDPRLTPNQREDEARTLMIKDESEDENPFGQQLAKTFHLADFFISATDRSSTNDAALRFVNALFGRTDIAPSKDEFGCYLAKTASLRSTDLSRQVGAAILSPEGDLIAIGCNEVPKPGGGNYWDEDKGKKRDIDVGGEANTEETTRIIFDFLRILGERGVIAKRRTPEKILEDESLRDAINGSLVGEITEYGRMVHAEMNAIVDAARLGRGIKGSTLYSTTFPCHNCAKHIIASGISKVVFVEPYPKSRTERLFGDFVSINDSREGKVEFSHFSGISPTRFLAIFQKSERRRKESGRICEWYQDECRPRIGEQESDYISAESHAITDNFPQ